MFSIPIHQRKCKKKNSEQKLDLWVEVWSESDQFILISFLLPAPVIIDHLREIQKFMLPITNVKDLFSNEYGSWFGRKKDNLNWKIYSINLSWFKIWNISAFKHDLHFDDIRD